MNCRGKLLISSLLLIKRNYLRNYLFKKQQRSKKKKKSRKAKKAIKNTQKTKN